MSDFLNGADDKVNMGMGDINIPYLKILQKLSPQCNEDDKGYVKGAKQGMFMDSITNKVYGKEVNIIPVYFKRKFIEWKPNRAGFVTVHDTEPAGVNKDVYAKWVLPNGNELSEIIEYYVYVADDMDSGIKILSLKSASIKYAKSWNTLIACTRLDNGNKAPFFATVWKLGSVLNNKDGNMWHNIGSSSAANVERVRLITEDEYVKYIKDAVANVEALAQKALPEPEVSNTKQLPPASTPVSNDNDLPY